MTRITSKALRFAALMLALVLSLALFAGCKGDKDNASSKEAASEVTTSLDNTEVVDQYKDKEHELLPESLDLGGYEVVFATGSTEDIIPIAGESAEGDLRLEKLRDIEEKYNCKVMVMEAPSKWDEAMTAIASGEEYANVIMPRIHQSGGFLQARLCADFRSSEISQYIDQSQPWWNETMEYSSNILGKVYAGASAMQNPAGTTWIVYFNKRIAKDLGIGENELYDLWEKGEWNWDNFLKYAKMAVKDQDGSGKLDSETDRWGLVAPGYDCAQAFASSAKVASVTTEDGMNPTYTFNTPHAINTLTKLNALFTTDGIYCVSSWDNKSYGTMFCEGKSLFYAYTFKSMSADMMREMEDDWGILPMPKGPKDGGGWQDKYISRVDHNFRLCMIPATVEDKASTSLVLEALTYKYFQIINDEIEIMANAYLRDDTSVEIANTIYNTSTYEISQFLYSINNGAWNKNVENHMRGVVRTSYYDISGNMNSVAELAQIMINDYFNGVT